MTAALTPLLAQVSYDVEVTEANSGAIFVAAVFYLIPVILMIAGMWKVFAKAGQPGWAAIIPIYNLYVWTKVANREAWWILLFLVPCVNIVAGVVLSIDTAKNFGKDAVYGVLMFLFPFIFWLILGFGSATYVGTPSPRD